MKIKYGFYVFFALFAIIVTGLRALQINVLNFKMGEISPLITTTLFIIFIKNDSFKLIRFNKFDLNVVIIPIIMILLIVGVDFLIQLQFNLINIPLIDTAFLIKFTIFLIIFTIGVGGFEEIAWRGYLISKIIQNRLSWNSLIIITGVIWSLWHLPTHFFKFENHLYIQYPLFIISCFELGIIMAYLRLKTDSVIPAIILHSEIAVLYGSFFKHSTNNGDYFYLSFPSIALVVLLIPLAYYYYKEGLRLYAEQTGQTLTRNKQVLAKEK